MLGIKTPGADAARAGSELLVAAQRGGYRVLTRRMRLGFDAFAWYFEKEGRTPGSQRLMLHSMRENDSWQICAAFSSA